MGTYQALSAFILDQIFGFQTANKLKERDDALAGARIIAPLGGSREVGRRTASYEPVPSYLEVELDGTNTVGLTVQARVEVKTDDGATSVTPRIRNVTDGADAVVGSPSTSTTFAAQTLGFVPVVGVKKYRLETVGSNNTNSIYGIGYTEHFA
ncbi:MAG TPA: hypothetical protein ENH89_09145 [Aurantimonas coralicida]|uniref:Uncharacterized protein n=1 Tax=Aurantimonas coralicida TaxID=182270 RepID=A0A9C9NFW8_9HYPH|nr:hypothetical protein [Aurantimonas coralicida]